MAKRKLDIIDDLEQMEAALLLIKGLSYMSRVQPHRALKQFKMVYDIMPGNDMVQ